MGLDYRRNRIMWYGKTFNDGNDNDAPRFIPVGKKPVTFIPVGKEKDYYEDDEGNMWKKEDWEKFKM